MTANILTLDGIAPAVDPAAWVAQTATLIGKVEVGAGSGIWYGCVLRGGS